MNRSWWYRFSLLFVVSVIAVMTVIPTLMNLDEEKSSFPMKSKINLGLDLQGGLYMVLGIDFKKVYKDEIQNYIKKVQNLLKDEGVDSTLGESIMTDAADPQYSITINGDFELAKTKIKEFYGQEIRITHTEGTTLTYGLASTFKTNIEENSVKKSIEVIRNRIDEFGVTEPEIVSLGSDRVVIQLPGVKDIERAKALIGKTAKLTFRIVNEELSEGILQDWMTKAKDAGVIYKKGERFSDYVNKMNEMFKKDIPKGNELVFKKILAPGSNEVDMLIPYIVESIASVTGDDLQDAAVRIDQENNQPYVGMTFNAAGAKRFENVTGENIGRRLAIILDGNVYSDPVVQARIGGGNAQVTLGAGNYNDQLKEARDLSLVLRAGALPVELDFQEQRIVGPSLGVDSIAKANTAGTIGAILVFLFMIIYYKVSGGLAATTLILNVIFMLACLISLGATLTLPGIAGIALTVGMAVDANIIIFERIKEEIDFGTPIREAVQTGFAKAFWTILDSNLTTAAAGLMLLNFGTGPIRGFAVTLIIGIMCTVYTAYFVSKIFFEFYLAKNQSKKLSI